MTNFFTYHRVSTKMDFYMPTSLDFQSTHKISPLENQEMVQQNFYTSPANTLCASSSSNCL